MLAKLLEQAFELDEEIDWSTARCRDGAATMVGLFFSEQIDDIARAKAICGLCPLAEPCFQGALDRRGAGGVGGGEVFAHRKGLGPKRQPGRPPEKPPGAMSGWSA